MKFGRQKHPVRAELRVGETYRNRCGAVLCVVERISPEVYVTESQSGWVQEIHRPLICEDGHIEWERSAGGHWKEGA